VLLFTATTSTQGQVVLEFQDKEKITIRLTEPTRFTTPTDFQFFKNNISGRLIFPNMDTATVEYEFDIEKIKTIKRNKEFELTITQRSQPKDKKKMGHFGRGFYMLTIKKKKNSYFVDKLVLLNVEI
jgi:predicted nucleotidyltransferase component of viral defense system